MVLISHTPATQENSWKLLIATVKSSPSFRASLKTSVRRILETRIRYFRDDASITAPDPLAVRSLCSRARARQFFT